MGRRGVLTVRLGTGVSRMPRHRCLAVAQREATGASHASLRLQDEFEGIFTKKSLHSGGVVQLGDGARGDTGADGTPPRRNAATCCRGNPPPAPSRVKNTL